MGLHTHATKGKRVIVTLIDGTVIEDRFVRRPKNNRWIELEKHGKIMRSDIKSMGELKGVLNLKRIKGKKQ